MFNNSFLLFLAFVTAVNCEYDSNVIDMDDILSEDLMPGTLFMLENPTGGVKTFNESLKSVQAMEKVPDGSFNNAMETMNFHRSMMNQYLCRNFVAEQIIKDMTVPRVNRRMGHVTPGSNLSSKFKSTLQNTLLEDEGSSSYKNWLTKSATLEDIYRHYDQSQNRIDSDLGEDEDKEDFDEEYSGYSYPQPNEGQTSVKHRGHTGLGMYYAGGGGYPYPNPTYHQGGGLGYQHGGSSSYHYSGSSGGHHGGGYPMHHGHSGTSGGYIHDSGYADYSDHGDGGGHSIHGGGPQHAVVETYYASSPPKYQGHQEASYGGKDHDLADLFDIALTALAFLSFGLFIVHVVMCITAAKNSTTTTPATMVMGMSMSPTATATGGTGTGNGGGGGSMTSTGGGGTGGGTTSTGTGGDSTGTGTGGGMPATGGGATGMGGGDTGAGGGDMGMGGGNTGTAGGNTSMGDGDTETGGGSTATGGGDIDGGGGGTSTGEGGSDMGVGDTGAGGGATGAGGGATGDGTTGGVSPGTGMGTGGGGTGDGMTGTGTGGGTTSTGTGADGATGAGRDTFKFRLRRDIPTITNPNNQALNELARRVLTSIEAALVAHNDGGVCLRKTVCENNKFSRTLDGRGKIMIPMWNLGMSWLAGRLVKNVARSTSMLDTLKASVLGLGGANCEIIYQECDLRRERRRRRRRRKRDVT